MTAPVPSPAAPGDEVPTSPEVEALRRECAVSKFQCPNCGNHLWGTFDHGGPEEHLHCNSITRNGRCGWTGQWQDVESVEIDSLLAAQHAATRASVLAELAERGPEEVRDLIDGLVGCAWSQNRVPVLTQQRDLLATVASLAAQRDRAREALVAYADNFSDGEEDITLTRESAFPGAKNIVTVGHRDRHSDWVSKATILHDGTDSGIVAALLSAIQQAKGGEHVG